MQAEADPQKWKKELGRRIVADFHGAAEADRVASAWGGIPDWATLDHFEVTDARLNRVLVAAKFVGSVTEADKLVKSAGSVGLFAHPSQSELAVTGPAQRLDSGEYTVRVGKRYKAVRVAV
jgi:tyrosyl-tRNA synthetase